MSDLDFSRLPDPGAGVFTAPLRRPAQVGEDWLEPAQHDYSAAEHAISLLFALVPLIRARGVPAATLMRGAVVEQGRLAWRDALLIGAVAVALVGRRGLVPGSPPRPPRAPRRERPVREAAAPMVLSGAPVAMEFAGCLR